MVILLAKIAFISLLLGPVPTEVEVRFFDEDPLTRAELEHRAWDRLGPDAERTSEMYKNGWPTVITRFAPFAGAA